MATIHWPRLATASLILVLAGCSVDAASSSRGLATGVSEIVLPNVPGDLSTTFTASGPLTVGSLSQLNMTITNRGSVAYTDTVFSWAFIPVGMKRQVDAPLPGDNPRIQCDAYRGTQGGFSQSLYTDFCRIWFWTGVPAGGSVTASLGVRPQVAGSITTYAGTQVKQFFSYVPLDQVSQVVVVNPELPKPTAPSVPDLQAGARASTGSPAVGSGFYVLMTAKNSGKADANDPSFVAIIPDGLTIASTAFDFGACSVVGQVISCSSTHPVFPGATATATIALVAPASAASFTLSGVWASSNTESNIGNNTSTVSVTIR